MDFTDNKWDKQAVNTFMKALLKSIPDLILFKDGAGRWEFASDYTLQLFGLAHDSYIGKTSAELSRITPIKQYRNILQARAQAEEKAWDSRQMTRSEVEFPQMNGRSIVLDVIAFPIFFDDGSRKALVIIGRDITDRKIAEERAFQLAYYDQLTKLPNRYMFKEELEKHIVISKTLDDGFVLMYLNVDRFKYINNTLGPGVGDQLLIQIAERLRQCVHEDSFLAHMVGDRFAILVPNVIGLEANLHALCNNMIESMRASFFVSNYELFMTATIGICSFPRDGEDADSLMKHADIALDLAKETGNGCYQIYNEAMDIAAFRIFSLENSLKKAMTMNQFEIYYQPKIEVTTNRIVGAEALIRWNHPEWGLTSPKEFIPLAEETGLIIPIGEWAIQTVCQQMKQWQTEGIDNVPISVNGSARQMMHADFVNDIKRILDDTDIAPHLLEIEVTETSLIDNEDYVMDVINRIRELGLGVAIDDFGTGYSVLSYLKQFNVDTIKIDRSFIQEIDTNERVAVIVQGIIRIVRSLNINVVAEGVERKQQLDMLKQYECDQIQGYLFSRPVSSDEFKQMLSKGNLLLPADVEEAEIQFVNRRRYFRVHMPYPLLAEMTITKFAGKDINLGVTEVLMWDIGLGGLSFTSNIKMAVRPDMTICITTMILGEQMNFGGRLVWSKEVGDDIHKYGLEFLVNENERSEIAKVLNVFAAKLRHNPILSDCPFVTDGIHTFFNQRSG